jgi:hypothetical protein
MRKKVAILVMAACLCTVAIGAVFLLASRQRLDSKARRVWKEKAVSDLTRQVGDAALIQKEIAALKGKTTTEFEWDKWISAHLILMTNGDWMAYRNVCAKEGGHIPDLFLGRGSDGKWYYSTYHFCIGMLVLKDMVGQPESLAKFRADCFLQEFDGRSDECLKKTWPLKH